MVDDQDGKRPMAAWSGVTLSPAVRAFLDGLALIIARDMLRNGVQHIRPADPLPPPLRPS
jgi:hypothetical protein